MDPIFLKLQRTYVQKRDGRKEPIMFDKIPDEEGSVLSPEELRSLIAQSKEIEGDDECVMCGS